jgi:hypothetical protein
MAMTPSNSRSEYLQEARILYYRIKKSKKYSRKKLSEYLSEVVEISGLNRKYLITLFNARRTNTHSGTVRGDVRGRKATYGSVAFRDALLLCWRTENEICPERLQPYLTELVPKLESCGELHITDEVRELLLSVSISTVTRILKRIRRRSLVPLGTTKPGTLLKSKIPIRKGLWSETIPGYCETDTVAHCGGNLSGAFIHSYNFVDIATSWSEQVAAWGMGEKASVDALTNVMGRFPFKVLGIDSDSGGEYINHHLWRFCTRNSIEFTRSRPGKKNDNAYVEQKNYTAIRRVVGYHRLDTLHQLDIMNRLYDGPLRLYMNYFQPTRKRKSKEYNPSSGKARKFYFEAKTPYQRCMESSDVSKEQKDMLQSIYNNLNPVQLLAEIRSHLYELEQTL